MKKHLIFLLLGLFSLNMYSQELTADELFEKARNAAFEKKDYPAAIDFAKKALERSPDYTDISVFLGRLYTWSDDVVKARTVFSEMYLKNVKDEDFFIAYTSLEYWNDDYPTALKIVEKGLESNPNSEALWILKVKILNVMENYREAQNTVNALLKINPKNTEATELAVKINELSAKNAFGVSYNYSHFDEQFADDWHMVTLSYKRVTSMGSVIFKGNYANKFRDNETQFEVEAYPKISDMFYLYVGAGYSNEGSIFPKYRTGASLNVNLPKSFEAEIGYRQLHFSDDIWMYTAAVGKYYSNFWFNLRTYITPDSENISHSYTATVRYYTKGAQDYYAFQIGTGISPEESRNNLLNSTETFKLKTYKMGAEYNFSVKRRNFFSISATYFNQEYRPGEKGNQYDISLGYSRKF